MASKKVFLKYFLIFFCFSFLIFNWAKIYWVLYPDYLKRVISFYLFEKKENKREEIEIKTEKIEEKKESEKNQKPKEEIYDKEDSIEIQKIGIVAPLIVVGNESEVKKALDRGVVLWPNSAFPGENGQTIILGHSAPPNWPKIKYDWVFSNLNLLEKGDEIVVYFKNRKYVYSVENKYFLDKGQQLPETDPQKSTLFLISCWPPGKNIRRIAVEAWRK
jgi:LPXTG-site transpeptidase (sortase) family protein